MLNKILHRIAAFIMVFTMVATAIPSVAFAEEVTVSGGEESVVTTTGSEETAGKQEEDTKEETVNTGSPEEVTSSNDDADDDKDKSSNENITSSNDDGDDDADTPTTEEVTTTNGQKDDDAGTVTVGNGDENVTSGGDKDDSANSDETYDTGNQSSDNTEVKDGDTDGTDVYDTAGDQEEEEAFDQEEIVDGVTVHVTAPKGVFPKGSVLVVRKADKKAEEKALEEVEEAGVDGKIADSYTFDITILDKDGIEIQPNTSRGEVEVSFTNSKVGEYNTTVFHHTEGNEAEELETKEKKDTATVSADGFSFYTIVFTYDDISYTYNVYGGTFPYSISVSEMLSAAGISLYSLTGLVSTNNAYAEPHMKGNNELDGSIITINKPFDSDVPSVTITVTGKVNSSDANPTSYVITLLMHSNQASIKNDPGRTTDELVYTGSSQSLLGSAGDAVNGDLKYAVVNKGERAPLKTDTSAWLSKENYSNIKATDAGTYRVYYYAKGDAEKNYGDSDMKFLDVTINKKELEFKDPRTITVEKEYDGTKDFVDTDSSSEIQFSMFNTVGGETATITGVTGVFGSPNVGRNLSCSLNYDKANLVVKKESDGSDRTSNYTLNMSTMPEETTSGEIKAREVELLSATATKTYDGEVNLGDTTFSNVRFDNIVKKDIGKLTISIDNGITYNSPSVSEADSAEIGNPNTGVKLDGEAKDNYILKKFEGEDAELLTVDAKINPRPITITGDFTVEKTYDGTTIAKVKDIKGEDAPTYVGLIESDTNNVYLTGIIGEYPDKNVGSYPYDDPVTLDYRQAKLAGAAASNYTFVEKVEKGIDPETQNPIYVTRPSTANGEITKRLVWVSGIKALDKVYDGTDKAEIDCTGAQIQNVVDNEMLTIKEVTGTFENIDVGKNIPVKLNYEGIKLVGRFSKNYSIPKADKLKQTYAFASITPRPVEIQWKDSQGGKESQPGDIIEYTYDGGKKQPVAEINKYSLAEKDLELNFEPVVIGAEVNAGTNTYYAEVTGLKGEGSTNYRLPNTNTKKKFKINPKEVTVNWSNTSLVYNALEQLPTAKVNGFVNGDKSGVIVKADRTSVYAGDYKARAVSLTNKNYKLKADQTTNFTIKKKPVTIEWKSHPMVYNGRRQVPTAIVKGLVGADSCNATVETDKDPLNAGTYTATATKIDNDNYQLEKDQKTTFVINKAGLTVKARNKSIKYGDKPANNGVTYKGFIPGEDPRDLGGQLKFKYSYKKNGKPGTYTITPYGYTSDNYDITYIDGKLKVSKVVTKLVGKASSQGTSAVKLSWNGVSDADRYVLYFAECTKPFKKIATLGSWRRNLTKKGLKKGHNYKFKVVAQKRVRGSYKNLTKSKTAHVVIGNKSESYTNQKNLKVPKTTINLKPGKTYKIKASYKKYFKDKKLLTSHAPKLRYVSSNKNVATVSKKGRIKAVKAGSCSIYVQTINGKWKIITVNVPK